MPPLLKTPRWLSILLLVKSKAFKVCLQSLYISNLSSPPPPHLLLRPPHTTSATLAVLLFPEHAGYTTASEPLHCLSLLPGTFLPQMNKANFPLSFKSLLKRHLLYEAYLDHPI